jgi:hypothetical protein
MGYLAAWKVLEGIIIEFRKKGLTIPPEVMDNLKAAKTMIKIFDADPCRGEAMQKIEEYLGNVESYLVSEGQKNFGVERVDEWLRRLNEASVRTPDIEEEEIRFIPGLPREQKWIRVKPSAEMPTDKLKTLAKESNLSCRVQSNGYLLVYGEDDRLKEFIKKMATKHGAKAEK